jgi:hypothetical protein
MVFKVLLHPGLPGWSPRRVLGRAQAAHAQYIQFINEATTNRKIAVEAKTNYVGV